MQKIKIIGGGLAGSEAAYYLLKHGYEVHLYERRPLYDDLTHHSDLLGELVCSNSLKSRRLDNACGLLKEEMRLLGSLMMEAASVSEVPGGNALCVDRDRFANYISDKLFKFPSFHLHRSEIKDLTDELTIVATGPLTDGSLLETLQKVSGQENLSFFDASSPIVDAASLNYEIVYAKSRFAQEDDAYLNCPFNKEQYETFVRELLQAERAPLHSFDTKYFEGCLPIEVIASRGNETLRHGPLKPFGLRKEGMERTPYAVAQLRTENGLFSAYNLVGFQTNLTYSEQKRVFSLIPGLEKARFLRYGLMHRNTYLFAPRVLNADLSLKNAQHVFIAGQLSGVEGYVESGAAGLAAAFYLHQRLKGRGFVPFPPQTILGSLLRYLTVADEKTFAPMNANWGLLNVAKKQREEAIATSLSSLKAYLKDVDE